MDADQQKAIELARTNKSFFLTGAGGTGKTYVIQGILDALKREGRDVALTALTGCAALLLGRGAKTLHSWAGIGLGKEPVQTLVIKLRKSFRAKRNWLAADTLIIDEVSMLTPELLDKLEEIARIMRRDTRPFGGLQLILVGDLYQLPPVNKDEERETRFVFEAATWTKCIQDSVILRTIHRQADPTFVKILNEARAGKLSEESIRVLETRRTNEWKKLEIKPTLLFTRKADVDSINYTNLKKCPGPDMTFRAKTVFTPKIGGGILNEADPEVVRARERMDKNAPYVPELVLRKGAQVMMIVNHSLEQGLVNGSRGVVEGFCEGDNPYPMVKFKNGETIIVSPSSWASEDIDGMERQQIPLRLAYAVTIHKAQGATLDCALVDIGESTFEYGQAYVALSRVRSLDCLYIWDFKPNVFLVHPKVKAFLDGVEQLHQTQSNRTSASRTAVNAAPSEPEDPTPGCE